MKSEKLKDIFNGDVQRLAFIEYGHASKGGGDFEYIDTVPSWAAIVKGAAGEQESVAYVVEFIVASAHAYITGSQQVFVHPHVAVLQYAFSCDDKFLHIVCID